MNEGTSGAGSRSAVIHGLTYGPIFKVLHQFTLVQAAILAVIGLAVMLWFGLDPRVWSRRTQDGVQ
jgi:hypothetical protein